METWTPRRRLLAVLGGRTPDRVPISTYELCGRNSLAWENREPSYAGLMAAIRRDTECICMWEPGSDEVLLGSSAPLDLQTEEGREDGTTVIRQTLRLPGGDLARTLRRPDDLHTVWQVEHWCKSLADVDRILALPFRPLAYDWADLPRIRREVGEDGILMISLPDPFWLAADLMEFGAFTVWARRETEHFAGAVARLQERVLENLGRMLAARPAELYRIYGPEYATPPFLPPALFARFVVPSVRAMADLIHRHGALVRFHCHGRIARVLDLILETGCDALDPCEAPPDGDIELAELAGRTGGRLCLFGNLEPRLLETGTAAEVEAAVAACMAAAKGTGRYVIMPAAAPLGSPLPHRTEENYLAFIGAALRLGGY